MCNHLPEEEIDGVALRFVFLLLCDYSCSVSLHRGAMGWSVIVVLPGYNHLAFGRGGSRITGEGVNMYKGVGGSLC